MKTSYKQTLRIHNQSKHGDIKFDCDQCEYKATTKSNLRVHTLSKHEGIIFDCIQNNSKKFSEQQEHTKSIHERIKYSCDQCDYKTSTSRLLGFINNQNTGILKLIVDNVSTN